MFVSNNGHMKTIGKYQIPLLDPQHHNHDPDEDVDEDVDEEWFQGRDGWD